MTDRLFQLEQEMQRLREQAESGLSAAQAYEDTPQTNRLLAIEQSLYFSKPDETHLHSQVPQFNLSEAKTMTTREMSCHVWALSGNPLAGKTVNNAYTSLMDEIGAHYDYGTNLRGKTLTQVRQETMDKVRLLCESRTQQLNNVVYICGGFREGQVCPEHVWLEDHTARRTYDTFINQDVRRVNRVGVVGQAFQPGCEASPFQGNEIARVQVNGYTKSQVESLQTAVVVP